MAEKYLEISNIKEVELKWRTKMICWAEGAKYFVSISKQVKKIFRDQICKNLVQVIANEKSFLR